VDAFCDPHNLPHWVIALLTLGLAVFAGNAWIEATRTTRTLEGQLQAMRYGQRPYVWATNLGLPQYLDSEQVVWTYHFTNVGKGTAQNVTARHYLKIGANEPYRASYGKAEEHPVGVPLPPLIDQFKTAVSHPGVSKQYFDTLYKSDRALGLRVEFEYGDGIDNYADTLCVELLASGALIYRDPKDCPKS
jgi:hypothetical protein